MLNLIWLAAIIGFAFAGWVSGLLALIAFFLLDLGVNVTLLRREFTAWAKGEGDDDIAAPGRFSAPFVSSICLNPSYTAGQEDADFVARTLNQKES